MNKSDLITAIAKKNHKLSDKEIAEIINGLIEEITVALEQGQRIELRGFGCFSIRSWGARFARNPTTGESWRTDPTQAVHFKPGKQLKERVDFELNSDITELVEA